MKTPRQYSAKVKAALIERRMKQKELAEKIGIAEETLSRKMRSPNHFNLAEMFLIQMVFDWTTLEG